MKTLLILKPSTDMIRSRSYPPCDKSHAASATNQMSIPILKLRY